MNNYFLLFIDFLSKYCIHLFEKIINLFDYLFRIAGENLEPGTELDLADLSGDVRLLSENKDRFVGSLIKEKETYILVKVEKGKTPDAKSIYAPLFTSDKIPMEDYVNKLNSVKKNKNNNQKGVVKNKQPQSSQHQPMLGTIKKKQSVTNQYSTIQSIEDMSPTPGD